MRNIHEYRTLYGRTFHSNRITDTQHWTPNDQRQMLASDISHHCLTLVHDGALFKAPLGDDLERVLDVGTGTGIWVMDFADLYPNTQITGTDIAPIQPDRGPPNVHFEINDATLDWMYPDNHFDYVHMRYMLGSIVDWPRLLRQSYRCCKPGGYVESFEVSCVLRSEDGSLVEGSAMDQWGKVFLEAEKKFGRPFNAVENGLVQDAFRKAGFADITEWEFKCPIGPWPKDPKLKEIGQYARFGISQVLEERFFSVWSKVLGWSQGDVGNYAAHLRRQLKDLNFHTYVMMRSVYGRKPETGGAQAAATSGQAPPAAGSEGTTASDEAAAAAGGEGTTASGQPAAAAS